MKQCAHILHTSLHIYLIYLVCLFESPFVDLYHYKGFFVLIYIYTAFNHMVVLCRFQLSPDASPASVTTKRRRHGFRFVEPLLPSDCGGSGVRGVGAR